MKYFMNNNKLNKMLHALDDKLITLEDIKRNTWEKTNLIRDYMYNTGSLDAIIANSNQSITIENNIIKLCKNYKKEVNKKKYKI